jgi:hypothetical protein
MRRACGRKRLDTFPVTVTVPDKRLSRNARCHAPPINSDATERMPEKREFTINEQKKIHPVQMERKSQFELKALE